MHQTKNTWRWRDINGLAVVLLALVAIIAMSTMSGAEYRKTVAALEAEAQAKSIATYHCDRADKNS